MNILKKIPLLIVLGVLVFMIANAFTIPKSELQNLYPVFVKYEEPFTEDNLREAIKELHFKHPEIVLAQAMLETGHFTSTLFKENNNLFGMKTSYSRPSTAAGIKNGHAYYNHWKDSLIDYALYTSAFMRYSDEEKVLSHLGKYYAEDPRYEKKIRSMIVSIEPL